MHSCIIQTRDAERNRETISTFNGQISKIEAIHCKYHVVCDCDKLIFIKKKKLGWKRKIQTMEVQTVPTVGPITSIYNSMQLACIEGIWARMA